MCGIVGYVGRQDAVPRLVRGLRSLEYRGYDSAGVAVLEGGRLAIRRAAGRLVALEETLRAHPLRGQPGIGHTRWATHGEPTEANAHPHLDSAGGVAVVHNGIIENYRALRDELERAGHRFRSQTDTEVLPHLIAQARREGAPDWPAAIGRALNRARGSYAVAILCADQPDTLYAARQGSPLIVGLGRGESFVASDVPALLGQIDQAIYLRDGELAVLGADGLRLQTLDGQPVAWTAQPVTLRAEAAERGGFETFMLKEIHEQPDLLARLLERSTTAAGEVARPEGLPASDYFRKLRRVMIPACGSAYHAGLYGKLLLESLTTLAVEVDLASEFRYRDPRVDPGTLIVPVSQSGETADTLASVRLARSWGCRALAVCNVAGSSLARECESVLFTEAGPEIGVASTKAFTAQLMSLALLALYIARARGELDDEGQRARVADLRALPDALRQVLAQGDGIRAIAARHQAAPSALYLGRRFNHPIALEGALKNKEISYQHAEGFAAGELKHGPIALVHEGLPVVCLCTRTDDEVQDKMLSNMKEVQARRGRIIAVATAGDPGPAELAPDLIPVPATRDCFSPLVNTVALQLLAYHTAQARGADIDRPRNLAKSVTVE